MRKALMGRKVGMTQIFDEIGNRVPVTVIDVSSNVIVEKKSTDGKAGYSALKIGFGNVHKHEKEGTEPRWRISRPEAGVFLKSGIDPRKNVREFRVAESDLEAFEVGQELTAATFTVGDFVDVTGTSKGSGFSGVMKRHNFHGGKATHGVHEYYRHGGSIGCSAYPARVFPGQKMPGQHGNAKVTIQNLSIVEVMEEDNAILVAGSVPGPNGGLVIVQSAIKKLQSN